jgi:hypothetical protein
MILRLRRAVEVLNLSVNVLHLIHSISVFLNFSASTFNDSLGFIIA